MEVASLIFCLATKAEHFDVKKLRDGEEIQPCFIPFDCLYLNGQVNFSIAPPSSHKLCSRCMLSLPHQTIFCARLLIHTFELLPQCRTLAVGTGRFCWKS